MPLEKNNIADCCGTRPDYYYGSTHQQINCRLCKREVYIRHSYSAWYDDYSPDWDLDKLVKAWNGIKPICTLDL